MIRDAKIVAEYALYIIFMICVFLIFALSQVPHYKIAYMATIVFCLYVLIFGLKINNSWLTKVFIFLGVIMCFSPTHHNVLFYQTDYKCLLSWSLIGIETFLINRAFLLANPKRIWVLKYFACFYGLVGVALYYYSLTYTVSSLGKTDITELANSFYSVLMPLPLLLYFVKNDWVKTLLFFSVFVAVIYTAKRSGLIIMFASSVPIIYSLYNRIKKKSLWILSFMVLVAIIFLLLVWDYVLSNERVEFVIERFGDLEEDQGSGRVKILTLFFNEIPNFTTKEFFLGRGYGSFATKFEPYLSCHNDYAELYYSFGILGLLSYVFFVIYFIVGILKVRSKSDKNVSHWLAFFIFLTIGFTGNIFFYYRTSVVLFIYLALFSIDIDFTNSADEKVCIECL